RLRGVLDAVPLPFHRLSYRARRTPRATGAQGDSAQALGYHGRSGGAGVGIRARAAPPGRLGPGDAMERDERVKLVLAASDARLGGTERVIWELATRLPEPRFAVSVWLPQAPEADELAGSLADHGLAVDRVPDVVSRWDWRGNLALWSRLRRQPPDLPPL